MTGSLRPRLLVVQGGRTLAAREIVPGDDWRLGRHADSVLPLQERSISRAHVRVFCDAAGVHLEDMGSPNGTFLDGKPVTGRVTLRDGNLVRLGQSTNPDPILLLFEDPGSRLLEAMSGGPEPGPPGVPVPTPAPAGPTPALPPPAPPLPTVAQPAAVPAWEERREEETVVSRRAPSAPGVERAAGHEPAGPEPAAPRRIEAAGRYAAAAVGVLVVFALGLVFALRATQKPWQSVRVEPMKVRPAGRVALRGPEVEPSDTLKVFVGEAEATVLEMAPGQIVFEAPRLEGGEAGVRPVPLRVERKGIVILRQTLQYETVPEVAEVEPKEATVGDAVVLRGSGFVSDPSRVKVRVGPQAAAVLGATASEIQFRVPVVTRSVALEAPVEVTVGEWRAVAPGLKVRPRDAPCFDLGFYARSVADKVWEVRCALGPVLLVEAPPPASPDERPEAVTRALETLRQVFARAQSDPTLRFEVKEAGRSPALLAVGLGPRPVEAARFTPLLAAFVRERAPEVRQTELVPYWSSVVLNELLTVFAKRQPPRLLASGDPLRVALKRLVDLNLETGGQGCPSAPEVQTLEAAEREVFEAASLRPPLRFGEVGGNWEGIFENVFADKPGENALELRLELKQAGTALEGRMLVYEVRGEGIRWSPPPVEGLLGRVYLGGETRMDLKVPPQPPYFITRLSAVLVEDALEGTFINDRRKTGRFHLVLKPGE
jgi:hypothetical protein